MSLQADYYELLGVADGASDAEIKAAYRKLAKQFHPDTGDPGDVERFRRIQEAYDCLSDPDRRRAYDEVRSVAGLHPVSWTGGFEETLRPFREELARPRRSAPVNVHVDIVLSEEEAHRGGEAVLEVPRERECGRCGGGGLDFFGWCSACRGDGFERVYEQIRFHIPGGVEGGEIVTARRRDGSRVRAQIRLRYF